MKMQAATVLGLSSVLVLGMAVWTNGQPPAEAAKGAGRLRDRLEQVEGVLRKIRGEIVQHGSAYVNDFATFDKTVTIGVATPDFIKAGGTYINRSRVDYAVKSRGDGTTMMRVYIRDRDQPVILAGDAAVKEFVGAIGHATPVEDLEPVPPTGPKPPLTTPPRLDGVIDSVPK